MAGKVWLVGAGPGDRGLFTIKGLEVLRRAEVVVYDALVGDEILTLIPENALKINVGKRAGRHRMDQNRINRTLLEQALSGRKVVRLKGGDPFLFGRGGEELELLAQNGIDYEVVPGVTSAFAVPAYNGIPVTHREYTSSVHIVTGHRRASGRPHGAGPAEQGCAGDPGSRESEGILQDPADPDGLGIDYEALVRSRGTLIFLMGLSTLPILTRGLLDAGLDPETPAAVLEKGTTAGQRRVLATVSTLEERSRQAQMQAPAIIVVGEVCRLAESFAWAEKRPLAGRKILLTRPKDLISAMAARLRELGAEVLELPAIETIPIDPNPALDECLAKYLPSGPDRRETAGSCSTGRAGEAAGAGQAGSSIPGGERPAGIDWIVFTSPTGVRIFMDHFLAEYDIRLLAGIRFAVIGEGSAGKLRQYGIRENFMPSVYDGETLGRELAQRIRTQGAARILIPRAAIGNRELVEELEKAEGVDILDIPTYNTEYVPAGIVDVRGQIEKGEIDCAVFTSSSAVRGFAAVTGDADLSRIRAVCIGKQTREAAHALGMETRVAEKATLDALIDAVVKCAGEECG